MRTYALLGAAFALAGGANAFAASLLDYNVIVTGNVTANSSKFYGTVAVGGNIQAINWPVFHKSIAVDGTITGSYHLLSGTATNDFDTTTYQSLMNSWSSYYQYLDVTSNSPTPANLKFTAVANVDNIAVFNVDGSIFSNQNYQNGWTFDIPDGVTTVINVSGYDIDFTKGNFNSFANRDQVIWNFYEATSLDLTGMGGEFQGTILAPYATLTLDSKHTNGNIYVANLIAIGGAELHLVPFDGEIPVGSTPPIPEPATLGFLLPIAAGVLLRRSRVRN